MREADSVSQGSRRGSLVVRLETLVEEAFLYTTIRLTMPAVPSSSPSR